MFVLFFNLLFCSFMILTLDMISALLVPPFRVIRYLHVVV